jgi:hypothetical protein
MRGSINADNFRGFCYVAKALPHSFNHAFFLDVGIRGHIGVKET